MKKETGSVIAANIFLLGYAISKKLIPLEEKFVLKAMEETAPKYFETNKKIFELGIRQK